MIFVVRLSSILETVYFGMSLHLLGGGCCSVCGTVQKGTHTCTHTHTHVPVPPPATTSSPTPCVWYVVVPNTHTHTNHQLYHYVCVVCSGTKCLAILIGYIWILTLNKLFGLQMNSPSGTLAIFLGNFVPGGCCLKSFHISEGKQGLYILSNYCLQTGAAWVSLSSTRQEAKHSLPPPPPKLAVGDMQVLLNMSCIMCYAIYPSISVVCWEENKFLCNVCTS